MKRTTKDRLSQLDAYATNMARITSYSPAVVATPQGIVIVLFFKQRYSIIQNVECWKPNGKFVNFFAAIKDRGLILFCEDSFDL